MKKIILCILSFICLTTNVDAKTYYSNYSEFTDFSEEEVEETELIEVQSKKFYRGYKENISYEYLEDSLYEKTGNYRYDYTEWTKEKTELDYDLEIETGTMYTYREVKDLDYFYIENKSDANIKINELKVITKDDEVLFENKDFNMYVNDIYIFEVDEYNINDISIYMDVDKQEASHVQLVLYMGSEQYELTKKILVGYLCNTTKLEGPFSFSNFSTLKIYQGHISYSYNDPSYNGKLILQTPIYRNVYKVYEYKISTIDYLDEYFPEEEAEDIKLDYYDYKVYYRYRKRDKVVLEDDLTITSKDTNINDFILESTTDDIKITSNMNLNINGKYDINFILPFKTIKENVIVDIKENYIDTIKEQEEYIDYLLETAEEANYKIDNKNSEIKEVIVDTTNETNTLKEELNSCTSKLSELNSKKDNLKVEEETKFKNQSFNVVILLILFTIIFITNRIVEKRHMKK